MGILPFGINEKVKQMSLFKKSSTYCEVETISCGHKSVAKFDTYGEAIDFARKEFSTMPTVIKTITTITETCVEKLDSPDSAVESYKNYKL